MVRDGCAVTYRFAWPALNVDDAAPLLESLMDLPQHNPVTGTAFSVPQVSHTHACRTRLLIVMAVIAMISVLARVCVRPRLTPEVMAFMVPAEVCR